MFPENWATDTELEATTWDLLSKAKEEYGVKLQPVTLQTLAGEPTWADSLTKLLAFNQTQYKRVLSLDSDSTVLKVSWLERENTVGERAQIHSNTVANSA